MSINYDDKRFTEVETDKKAALAENEKLYGGMVSNTDKYFQDQIDASKDWADKQTQIQQEQTDFAIEKVEQQKDQAKKDYTKEQSGAYVDWQKQSNQHGVRAEQMADKGMQNTGYSESSQVSMYNTYQNRVATARESYVRAVQNYDNAITEARLQNNSALAEIAYKALQQQLELSLQGFQYKNTLLLEQANKKFQIESEYHNRYQDVLNQINTENALAEEIRQFNESMAWEKYVYEQAHSGSSGGGGGGGGGGPKPKLDNDEVVDDNPKVDTSSSIVTPQDYLNAMVKSGANKSQVVNEINKAQKSGEISKQVANGLKAIYNKRGEQYQ
jgi:hypothetical protein